MLPHDDSPTAVTASSSSSSSSSGSSGVKVRVGLDPDGFQGLLTGDYPMQLAQWINQFAGGGGVAEPQLDALLNDYPGIDRGFMVCSVVFSS